jgi:hypothetical protein
MCGSRVDSDTYAGLFESVPGKPDFSYCKICMLRLKAGKVDKKPMELKNKPPGNLIDHLLRCSPENVAEAHKTSASAVTAVAALLAKLNLTGDKELPAGQQTLSKHLRPVATFGGSNSAAESQDNSVEFALFCLYDMRPWTVVEGIGFQDLMKRLAPKAPLCSRKAIARRVPLILSAFQRLVALDVLPRALGHSTLTDVRVALNTAPYTMVSLTTDGWTSRSGDPFLCATLHFITREWELKSIAIALRKFAISHTADAHCEKITQMLADVGVAVKYLLGATTDNASTMLAFMRMLDCAHQFCLPHTLHLVVKDIKLDELLEPVLQLAKYFSAIAVERNRLVEAIARTHGVTNMLATILPVTTRWGSWLAMLKRHIKRWVVMQHIPDPAMLRITDRKKAEEYRDVHANCADNLSLFEGICALLQPMDEWSIRFQSSAVPTVSLILPCFLELRSFYEPSPKAEHTLIRGLRAKLLDSIMRRLGPLVTYHHEPLLSKPISLQGRVGRWLIMAASTVLDPYAPTAVLDFLAPQSQPITQFLCDMYNQRLRLRDIQDSAEPKTAPTAVRGNLFLDAANLMKAADSVNAAAERYPFLAVEHMATLLSRFLSDEKDPADGTLSWWAKNEDRHPVLAVLARSLLSMQASSAASERLFSVSGMIVTPLRSQLSTQNVEAATLVRAAVLSGIDLRPEIARLQRENAQTANQKRSASVSATLAAKKKKTTAPASSAAADGAAGGGPSDSTVALSEDDAASSDGDDASTGTGSVDNASASLLDDDDCDDAVSIDSFFEAPAIITEYDDDTSLPKLASLHELQEFY